MKINIISSSLRSTGFCIALACLLAMPACSQTTTPVAVPMSEAGDLLQDVHHTFNIEIREDGSV